MNGDGELDIKEIEAIMEIEATALHTVGGKTDEASLAEEVAVMREQMTEDYDTNRDLSIDFQEFLDYAEGEGFIDDAEWHAVNADANLVDLSQSELREVRGK